MKLNRALLLSVVSLSLVIGLFIMLPGKRSRQTSNKLVAAMMSGWAPFMAINDQGEYEGFDVDVARELANRMGKELEIIDLGSLAPTFIALDQGKADIVMSGLEITQERRARYSMIPYAGENVKAFYLLFWSQVPQAIRTIDDLKKMSGAVVCVEPGSSQEKFLDSVPEITQKPLAKVEEMVMDVQYGKSLAILLEPQIAQRLVRLQPQLKSLAVPLPDAFQTFGVGIALKKDNSTLVDNISSLVNQMKKDGTLGALCRRWQVEVRND